MHELDELPEVKEERLEHFLWIYASSGMRVGLSQRTSFAGLGPKRAYGIVASFKAFVNEVCARAPQAIYDERLVRMARWKLGLISEDADSHEAMAELVWQAVLTGAWPLE